MQLNRLMKSTVIRLIGVYAILETGAQRLYSSLSAALRGVKAKRGAEGALRGGSRRSCSFSIGRTFPSAPGMPGRIPKAIGR